MGAVPSTPRRGSRPREAAEFLIGALVGDKPYPVTSDFWRKLLEVPLALQWPQHRVLRACELFAKIMEWVRCIIAQDLLLVVTDVKVEAQNNFHTHHLAKILVHLVWSLQESMSPATSSSMVYSKAINAAYMSSTFLKYLIENAKLDNFEDLYITIDEGETKPETLPRDENISKFVMREVLTFISTSEVSPQSCLLHHELLNFMIVAMSTQLRSAPTPGPGDVHPFIDAAMMQENAIICSVVRRLLVNYITRPRIPFSGSSYPIFSEEMQPGVLQRVGSAADLMICSTSAANFVLLPYYTFNYLVSSSAEGSRSLLADNSLLLLLILIHYKKCVLVDEPVDTDTKEDSASYISSKENSYFSDNPYCKALENARDIEFDRLDIEGNAQSGHLVRIPFASLFDTLGLCLSDESSVLLLYSLVHGNSDFLEYVLVRTDLDTLLMPILETLYNAPRRTSNQIYMLLIILLILSQDSSFNTSIHKLILPNVPWYQERLLHNTSLGSLMVIILIRTVKYNLSKLRDVYLHTNCLATLANMAPHVHRLSGYASQRLVSLFDMLARKYSKSVELKNDKSIDAKGTQIEGGSISEDASAELQIYTDFLRIVLEIVNAILTYALPRNPEVVYAIMHRQEVFQPFKNHPRFNELLENIYMVLDFFNSRMDTQQTDGELSVDKVLQVIIINCRSWRGEGMKMFTQLKFTYEQESNPEEFFIPYVWQLVLSTR
ncbi:hypothetical protein Taro_012514 [Colocasia esculenta]|uniref:Dymeclin n=1 Tax=Colocasia esculenta TaxID=4460 RepID=A0A843UDT5_COLES|nr:hypothetical protein [Colocasia esculenta]